MLNRLHLTRWVFAGVVAAAGCSSQAGEGYQGEPIAKIVGAVINETDDAPEGVEVALWWLVDGEDGDSEVGEVVEVRGEFPANFELSLFEPPPDGALNDWDGERFGIADILVSPIGATERAREDEDAFEFLGGAEDYVLVYVDRDLEPDGDVAEYLGGALSRGYHILEVHDDDDDDDEFDDLVPAPADTRVPVRMIEDPEDYDWPNFT